MVVRELKRVRQYSLVGVSLSLLIGGGQVVSCCWPDPLQEDIAAITPPVAIEEIRACGTPGGHNPVAAVKWARWFQQLSTDSMREVLVTLQEELDGLGTTGQLQYLVAVALSPRKGGEPLPTLYSPDGGKLEEKQLRAYFPDSPVLWIGGLPYALPWGNMLPPSAYDSQLVYTPVGEFIVWAVHDGVKRDLPRPTDNPVEAVAAFESDGGLSLFEETSAGERDALYGWLRRQAYNAVLGALDHGVVPEGPSLRLSDDAWAELRDAAESAELRWDAASMNYVARNPR